MQSIVKLKNRVNGDEFHFQLVGTNSSIANSIRRTILSDIPSVVIDSEKCVFFKNTTRLHNELLKQRLGQIPVFISGPAAQQHACDNYELIVKVENQLPDTVMITTEDFQIRDKTREEPNAKSERVASGFISRENVEKIFPPNQITRDYIDFGRMRGKIANCISAEELHLVCPFKMGTGGMDGSFAAVSKATYQGTIDDKLADKAKDEYIHTLKEENKEMGEQELAEYIEYKVADFQLLDRQRYVKKDSFNFQVVSIGVYTPVQIVEKACHILIEKLQLFMGLVADNTVQITAFPNYFYEFSVPNDTYTISKIVEFALLHQYFEKSADQILTSCAVKRSHPHVSFATIRLSTRLVSTEDDIKLMIRDAGAALIENYNSILKGL